MVFYVLCALAVGVVPQAFSTPVAFEKVSHVELTQSGGLLASQSDVRQAPEKKLRAASPCVETTSSFGGHGGSMCMKEWQKNPPADLPEGDCPFGEKLPGDVTWPDYAKARKYYPNEKLFLGDVATPIFCTLSVTYSYIPYVFALGIVIKFLVRRGTRELMFLGFLAFLVACNEVLVKPFLKAPRPALSCLISCGMPSSHAAISTGTVTLFMAHSMFRTAPVQIAAILQMENAVGQDGAGATPRVGGCASLRKLAKNLCEEAWAGVPLDEPTQGQIMMLSLTWIVLLLPVPICRIANGDHTPGQVMVGGLVGLILAIVWSVFKGMIERRFQHLLGREWWYGGVKLLSHNLALPCYQALLDIEAKTRSGNLDGRSGMIRELQWYELETLTRCTLNTSGVEDDHERYLKFRWCLLRDFIDRLETDSTPAAKLARSIQGPDSEKRFIAALTEYWSWAQIDELPKSHLKSWKTVGMLQASWLQTRLALDDDSNESVSQSVDLHHLRSTYLGGSAKCKDFKSLVGDMEEMQQRHASDNLKLQSDCQEQLATVKRRQQHRKTLTEELKKPELATNETIEDLTRELEASRCQQMEEQTKHDSELVALMEQHKGNLEEYAKRHQLETKQLQEVMEELGENSSGPRKHGIKSTGSSSILAETDAPVDTPRTDTNVYRQSMNKAFANQDTFKQQSRASTKPSMHSFNFVKVSLENAQSSPGEIDLTNASVRRSTATSSQASGIQDLSGQWRWGTELVFQISMGEMDSPHGRSVRHKTTVISSSSHLENLVGRELVLIITPDRKIEVDFGSPPMWLDWPHALDGCVATDAQLMSWAYGERSKESRARRQVADWTRVEQGVQC